MWGGVRGIYFATLYFFTNVNCGANLQITKRNVYALLEKTSLVTVDRSNRDVSKIVF